MDTGVRRRTRLQHDLFYKKYFEEKKKAERCNGATASENSMKSDLKRIRAVGGFSESEGSGTPKVRKSGEGSIRKGEGVGVNEDYGEIKSGGRGVRNRKQVGSAGSTSLKGGKLKRGKSNVRRRGVVCESDESESSDDDGVKCLGESVENDVMCFEKESEGSVGIESCKKDDDECLQGLEPTKEDVKEQNSDELGSSNEDKDDPQDSDFVVVISSSSDEEEVEGDKTNRECEDEGIANEESDEEVGKVEVKLECVEEHEDKGEEKSEEKLICGKEHEDKDEEIDEQKMDEEDSSDSKERSCNDREMTSTNFEIEGGFHRKRTLGLDILVDFDKRANEEYRGPATRLRSRNLSRSRKKMLKLGGISHPVPVEEYGELVSSSESDSRGNNGTDLDSSSQSVSSGSSSTESFSSSESDSSGDSYVYNKNIMCEVHGTEATDHRSKFFSKSRKTKLKSGSGSQPVPVKDYKKLDSSSEYDIDRDNVVYQNTYVQKVNAKGKQGSKKRWDKKHTRDGEDLDVIKILTDSIREDGDKLLEGYACFPEEAPVKQISSYKFDFEDEEDKPPEKEEWEIEVDELFAEMYMCSGLEQIGSFNSHVVVNDDLDVSDDELDQATRCCRGKHKLILHDEFGILCRFCSHVEVEMKDILPPLNKNPFGRQDRHDFGEVDNADFSDLHFKDWIEYSYGSKGCNIYEKGTVWDLVPGVRETMYPHQREGFEFIWKNIAGETHIEKLNMPLSQPGRGCIISHAPGTGKSRLTIVFLQSFLKMYPICRPLIIAPRSMLLTWEEEFKKWEVDIPFHIINKQELSGWEDEVAANLLKKDKINGRRHRSLRLIKLFSWKKQTSILGITYRLFEELAGGESKRKNSRTNPEDEDIKKILLGTPSLVVLDEGHTPRNDNSLIWKALSNVETHRRIILSGTPFQNNFDELYNTLCLVNPRFVEGIISRNCNDFDSKCVWKRSKARGKWASLTSSIGKKSDAKLNELKAMIAPFVHVHKGTILQEKLPGLRDVIIVLKPTRMQQSFFQRIEGQLNMLKENHLLSLISVHPSLLLNVFSKQAWFSSYRHELEKLKRDPYAGVKTKFLIELIQLSQALNERVLVFSQFISPLEFIMRLLKAHFGWIKDRDFLYMDGQQEEKLRQSSISSFNDPNSEVKVLLASIRACSEGISLVGASRVVILDVHWNPSVERQAISRAYRLGQKKFVYIYHLLTGTMEGEKYIRQVEKSRLSELVFSSKDINAHKPEISSTVLEDKILEGLVQHDKLSEMFEKVIYQPKESDLVQTFGLVDTDNTCYF